MKFRSLFWTAAVLSFIVHSVFAMDRPASGWEDYWWQTHLGAPLNHDQPFSHLDEMNGASNKLECVSVTKPILSSLQQYAELSSQFSKKGDVVKSPKALTIQQGLRQSIFHTMSPTDKCYDAAVKTYFLGSVYIAMPDFIHLPANWESIQNGSGSINSTMDPSDNELLMGKVMTASVLLNRNFIQFLTHDKRTELGTSWTDSNLLGAYECASSQIFIDPDQAPFDLGAAFIHELDHLQRDKFYSATNFQYDFLSRMPEAQAWEAFLTVDETFASVAASSLQRNEHLPVFGLASTIGNLVFPSHRVQEGMYHPEDDLDLVNPHGPLEKLFRAGGYDSGYPVNVFLNLPQTNAAESARPFFPAIFDLVHSIYFGGQGLGKATDKTLIASRLDSSIDSQWNYPFTAQQVTLFSTMHPDDKEIYQGIIADSMHEPDRPLGVVNPLILSYVGVDLLLDSMSGSSSLCDLYQTALGAGDAAKYIGREYQVSDPNPSPSPQTSGSPDDTTKPGEGGVRPGEGGVRPGEGGVRPGEGGVRPGVSVRPCLDTAKKL